MAKDDYHTVKQWRSSFTFIIPFLIFSFLNLNSSFCNSINSGKTILDHSLTSTCATGVNITRRSASEMYINDDISPEKRGQYLLYEIDNTSAIAFEAYVRIDNFIGDIRLGDQASEIYSIGILAPGEVGHAYFYVVTDLTISGQNGSVIGTNTHDINVYNGNPEESGALLHSENFEINIVEDVIKANANKVIGVTVNETPLVGETFSITVNGETGTIGAALVVNFSAATHTEWPANDLKLVHTIVDFSKINGSNGNDGLSFENELNFTVLDTKNTAYEITYTFEVLRARGAISDYEPTAYISSGTQFKHSILSSGAEVQEIPASESVLSGFVWSDDNYDGIKQSGEAKMNGVKVRLLDSLGNQLESTTSSGSSGDFEFQGITAGTYQIRFDRNDRFVATKQNATIVDSLNSDMNRATRLVELNVIAGTNISDISAGFTPDFDRDLIPDAVENAGSTSYDAVDPAGYFYDEATGESISGGLVVVSGPGAINIVDDGSATGYYSWLIDGTPGVYTMTVLPPGGYELSSTRLALPTLDPTGLTPDPYSIGSGDDDADGFIDDFSASANPFYLTFELASGDPFVINNNIPLSAIVLPVEISKFEGIVNDCSVELKWTTETEERFHSFEIQRSSDGINFQNLANKMGQATYENQRAVYNYFDRPPFSTNYYRLKMIDLDGSYEFSEIIAVRMNCQKPNQSIKIFPNPIGAGENQLTITVDSSISSYIEVDLINAQGVLLKKFSPYIESGINEINWEISGLSEGVYFLVFNGEKGKKNVKRIIKN